MSACLLIVLAATAVSLLAQPPPSREMPAPPGKDNKPAPVRLEDIKVPADAILLVCERAADALRALPKFYLVPLDRFDALQARIKQLEKQLQAKQPAPITKILVTGKVQNGVVDLKAIFEFVDDKEHDTVTLGCRQAQPTGVQLDDKLPAVLNSAEGVVLEVEHGKPRHEAVLELKLLVKAQTPAPRPADDLSASRPMGGARPPRAPPTDPLEGFELDLPRATVTNVELELPDGARAVEVNDQPLRAPLERTGNQLKAALGKAGRLKVAWTAAAPGPTTPVSLATVKGRITVRLGHRERSQGHATTDAELTLQDLGRSVKDWQLQLPERAQVRLANPADKARLRGPIQGSGAQEGRVVIPLREPGSAPLVVAVSVPQVRTSGSPVIGPFTVHGAASQLGTVWVVCDPDQRVRCLPFQATPGQGPPPFEVTPRKLERPDGARAPAGAVAAFQYWSGAAAAKADPRSPWFKLEAASIQGMLDTRLLHTLRLLSPPGGPGGAPGWRLTTTVEAVPVRAGVDELKIEWPAPWQFDRERGPRPLSAVSGFKEEASGRLTRFELAGESLKPFKLELEANPVEAKRGEPFPAAADFRYPSAIVPLPRPRDTSDRGEHLLTVHVPDDLDVRVPQPPNPALELVSQETHKVVWRGERFPKGVAVAWKPYRPDVRADSVIDVTLKASHVEVRHRLQLAFNTSDRAPDAVLLRLPPEVTDLLVVDGGHQDGAATPSPDGSRTIRCVLSPARPPAAAGQVADLVFQYRAAVPPLRKQKKGGVAAAGRLVPVPLVAAAEATHGQVSVRVWGEPGSHFSPLQGGWEEGPRVVERGRSSLPALVLNALRPTLPLTLRWETLSSRGGHHALLVDRALLQVRVTEGGFQHYRARFLLRRLGAASLDLAFPAALAALDVQVNLDDQAVGNLEPVAEPASAGGSVSQEGTRVARVFLPAGKGRSVLEISYQLVPGRTADGGSLRTILQPVTLPGLLAGVPTRWQVDLPPDWVPLSLEGGSAASWQWGRRGWLLAPRPAVTQGDLEQWFRGEAGVTSPGLTAEEAGAVPSFVCWRGGPGPLTLVHVPQQAWLLVCSLGLLAAGLALYFLPLGPQRADASPNRLFWPLLALAGLTAAALGLVWPGLLAALLYGCQPGLLILLFVLGVQWLLHERYRRRVVFLPGFRRVKTGSSLVRAGSSGGAARPEAVPPLTGAGSLEGARPNSSATGRAQAPPKARSEPSTVDEPPLKKDE